MYILRYRSMVYIIDRLFTTNGGNVKRDTLFMVQHPG